MEDIWKKVDKKGGDDCWNWIGQLSNSGYGKIKMNNKTYSSHRLIYEFTFGMISDGLQINHICNNRKCCNPTHLQLGNQQDNMTYMVLTNRSHHPIGETHPNHKLTEDDIIQIRSLYVVGNQTQSEIGKLFGVAQTTICAIVNNINWKHI
jgi:hypothetical protein